MAKVESKSKRNPLSKSLRFEVFKRDHFTCQYCGRKAPEVVLHVDHITPVSKGGTNDLMNLVTSCVECNLGKSDRKLSDDSIVMRKNKQAEILAQRLEQIEMLRDWHIELASQNDAEVEAVNSLFKSLTNNQFVISENYKKSTITPLIKKFGLAVVLDGLAEGARNYGDPEKALNKLGGICACKADPILARRIHILNRMRKRFWKFDWNEGKELLEIGYNIGGDEFFREVEFEIGISKGTWYQVKKNFWNIVDKL